MKRALLAFKIGIITLTVAISAVSASSIYSVVGGGFQVELPEEGDITWRVSGTSIIFETQANIKNGGTYPIEDMKLDIRLVNGSGYEIISHHIDVPDIPAKTDRVQEFELPLDLAKLHEDGAGYLAFESEELTLEIDIEAYYSMKLIRFSTYYQTPLDWTPVFGNLDFSLDDLGVTFNGSQLLLDIPLTSDIIGHLKDEKTDIDLSILNSYGDIIGKLDKELLLGTNLQDSFLIDIDENASYDLITNDDTFTIDANFSLGDIAAEFGQSYKYDWGAPLSGLDMTTEVQGSDVIMNVSFENKADWALDGAIEIDVKDSTGNSIGNGMLNPTVSPGEAFDDGVTVPTSGVPHHIVFTFIDSTTGLSYELAQPITG